MRKVNYTMLCHVCGKQFETTQPRLNCYECGLVRKCGVAVQELIRFQESGGLITSTHIDEITKRYKCTRTGIYQALRREGFKNVSAWLRIVPTGGNNEEV